MSTIAIINIIFVNAIIIFGVSYYWSKWTFKLFKPYRWQEKVNLQLIHRGIEEVERKDKDKVRTYTFWYLLERLEDAQVEGALVCAGIENMTIPLLMRLHNNERKMFVVDPFENKNEIVEHENCNGEVTKEKKQIDYVRYVDLIGREEFELNTQIVQGRISDEITKLDTPIAFIEIDSVSYNDVYTSLTHAYKHLSKGGIMVVHDYNHIWTEVKAAVDRFQMSVPECFVPVADSYGSVILVKNR